MTRINRPSRALALGASAVLLGGLLAGCSGSASSANGTAGGRTPVAGGTIVYAHEQEAPCIYGGWIQQAYTSRQVLDGLVTLDDHNEVKPWLATSWTVSPDGLKYIFTLKSGVKFTDGTPVDAAAIAFNFNLWENGTEPKGNSTAKVSIDPYYKSAKAIDALHVEVDLTERYGQFLTLLTQGYFGIQSPASVNNRTDAQVCEKPIGSGAFTVAQWKRGEEIDFAKNPNYTSWPSTAKHQGPALVDKIVWKIVPDGVARYASLTTGQTNLIYDVPTVDWTEASSRYDTIRYITPGKPVSAYLNTTKGRVFDDVRVRQAFAYGADRKSAVEAGFHGVIPYEPNGAVSQATPGYNKDVTAYPYDPAKANQLLDQAGWVKGANGIRTKNGKPLHVDFVYPAGDVWNADGATVLQALQEQWKQVGFDVNLIPATHAETFSGKFSGPNAYDALGWYWTSPSPAILWIVWRPTTKQNPNYNNSSFYNNEHLSQVIQAANSEPDQQKAYALYEQAQQIISDDEPILGIYTQNSTYASAKNLKDFWVEKSQGEPVFSDAYLVK